jgi:hypothetical protein
MSVKRRVAGFIVNCAPGTDAVVGDIYQEEQGGYRVVEVGCAEPGRPELDTVEGWQPGINCERAAPNGHVILITSQEGEPFVIGDPAGNVSPKLLDDLPKGGWATFSLGDFVPEHTSVLPCPPR